MAHKTFISYKYSEAQDLRDRIIDAMGKDYAQYYNGEDGFSDDISSLKAATIKKKLADMMFDTSVTIVIISPQMKQSKWIDWEIEYCLKLEKRKDGTSRRNGVVGVIMKVDGGYDWFKYYQRNSDGCISTCYYTEKVFDIINNNRFNQDPPRYSCDTCKCVNALTGSYVAFVEEEEFLSHFEKYVNNAYDKSVNDADGYIIKPSRY